MISPIHIILSVQNPKERGTDKGCQVYSGAFVLLTGQSNAMIIFLIAVRMKLCSRYNPVLYLVPLYFSE